VYLCSEKPGLPFFFLSLSLSLSLHLCSSLSPFGWLCHSLSQERLIEKLIDPFYADPEFVSVFLTTHRYFITSVDLLRELTKHYRYDSVEAWAISQRLRILGFLRHWTNAQIQRLKEDRGTSMQGAALTLMQRVLGLFFFFQAHRTLTR
jgi:RasGEF N-terminal motif